MNESEPEDFVEAEWLPADELTSLVVRVQSAGFAGHSRCWAERLTVAHFAVALQAYPLPAKAPVSLSLNSGVDSAHGEIGMSAAPVGTLGQVVLTVRLSEGAAQDGTPARSVSIDFPTSYEALGRFSRTLHTALDHGGHARLDFDQLE